VRAHEKHYLSNAAMSKAEYLPLHRPWFGPAECRAARATLASLRVGGNGPICREVEQLLCELLDVRHALLTTSCTHAMEAALMACNVGPGDEVILPSFTFPTTATAILRQGARPVFADIDAETYNLDPASVEEAVTERTVAIMPVHYAGQGCEMDELQQVAQQAGAVVIEDAAHAIGATYGGRFLGTIGRVGCLSFHETKNITCGEGGAALTDDDETAERLSIIREKGTNRAAFLRGEVDKYTWVSQGSSFVLAEVLAAILREQLRRLPEVTRRRRRHAKHLLDGLADLEPRLKLPVVRPGRESNWHLFAVRVGPERQQAFIGHLRLCGIGAAFHYVPLHTSPFGQSLGYRPGDLPVTEEVSLSLVRLPLYPQLRSQDVERIIAAVRAFFA